jgi:hypothetical protein
VRSILRTSWLALLGATLALSPAARSGTISDKEMGYSIFVPKDFDKKNAEGFAFDGFSFFSDYYRLERLSSKDELATKEWFNSFRRTVALYYFPTRTAADIAKLREEREKQKEKEKAGGKDSLDSWFSLDRVYLSFEEYAKANIQGFYFGEQKPAKYGGFECTVHEMVFEKLTSIPQRWLACSYKVPGGEFAVVFTCTEQHFKKYRGEMIKTFGTFKLLKPTGLVPRDPNNNNVSSSADIGGDDDVDVTKLTADEKAAHWAAVKEKAFAQVKADLGKGWDTYETKHFLVCYDGDAADAKKVSKHGEAVILWLAERFGSLSTNPTQSMILRINSSKDAPQWSFRSLSNDPAAVVTLDVFRDYNSQFDLGDVAAEVMWKWFNQKNSDLSARMPWWLRSGLSGLMNDSESKAGKLDFGIDTWERESMAEAIRADKEFKGKPDDGPLKPLRTLLMSNAEEIYGKNFSWGYAQCSSVVRYFLEGPGSRNEKTRSTLQHYLANLSEKVAEVEARLEAEREAAKAAKPDESTMTDEERLKAEDEQYKKKRETEYDKIETELLTKSFEATFAGWDDAAWKTLDANWLNFAKSRVKAK